MKPSFKQNVKSDFLISRRFEKIPSSMQNYQYHNAYEIYYLCSGERYYFIQDKIYHIKKGDLVLISEYTTHCTAAAEDIPYERILCIFKKPFLNDIVNLVNENLYECFNKNIYVLHLDDAAQEIAESILHNMLNENTKKNIGYKTYLKTYLIQLLLFTKRHIGDVSEYSEEYVNSTHRIISEATGYINNNFREDITLEFMSDKFFISTYYFSRIFRKSTGLTFIEYLNSVRIKEAQKLLATTKLSITEISEIVGYKSSVHFWRIFKKISGVSPSEYRKLDDI